MPGSLVPTNPEEPELFKLLVATVRDYAIFMLDPHGRVATWNAGAKRIKGYEASEIIGRHFSAFYPQSDIDAGKCEYELEVASREGRFEDEGWRVRKDGTQFWANVVITALRDTSGELVGFAKVTRDLTDRKRNEEERAARIAAEQANRAKDEFLAMLGHELRNPLAPIVTALELIKLREDDPYAKEHDVIERQVTHMTRLVDDLLDVARITGGKIELKWRHLDLRDLVKRSLEIAGPLFEERGHHTIVDLPPEPVAIRADERRMIQVVSNLLTNAAKYTPPGGHITVSLRADRGNAILQVRDDGQGISAELLPRVFELFVQGAQSSERPAGGLGLGLTLVQRLVALHGGTVQAASPGLGRGSVFTVSVPLSERPVETSATSFSLDGGAATAGQRVMVVDDNEDARELLADVLRAMGYDVRVAGDAYGALSMVDHYRPTIAILDIGLPVMDGFELARRLREKLGPAAPRLVALSGYAQPADREKSRSAGFAVHLVKPVDARKLLDVLAGLPPSP